MVRYYFKFDRNSFLSTNGTSFFEEIFPYLNDFGRGEYDTYLMNAPQVILPVGTEVIFSPKNEGQFIFGIESHSLFCKDRCEEGEIHSNLTFIRRPRGSFEEFARELNKYGPK